MDFRALAIFIGFIMILMTSIKRRRSPLPRAVLCVGASEAQQHLDSALLSRTFKHVPEIFLIPDHAFPVLMYWTGIMV